jgi:hypothetical protein
MGSSVAPASGGSSCVASDGDFRRRDFFFEAFSFKSWCPAASPPRSPPPSMVGQC